MKTFRLLNFKSIFALLILVSVFNTNVFAQTPQYYNSNTGTSSNSFPFNMSGGKAVNSLIAAGEFILPTPCPAGMQITTVYFRTSSAGTRTFTDLRILMAQDVITTLTSGTFYAGPYDTVYYNASVTLTSTVGGWMSVTLNHPFSYDITKSLILFVGQCGYTGTGTSVYNSTFTGIRRVWSVGGCPFVAYAGGDASMVNFGIDVSASGPAVPTLLSPPNGATGLPTSDTLIWNASSGASSYRVQLATDSLFTSIVVDDSTVTGTSKFVTGLLNSTIYYWRVRAKSSGGTSGYSSIWNFTTITAPPSPPALVSPPNGATGLPLTDTLVWNPSSGATSYRVQLATDSLFTAPILNDSTVTGTSKIVTGLLNLTKYYWRVNAKNAGGTSSYSLIWNFTTITAAPVPPTLVSPTNGATGLPLTDTLVWNPSSGATSYRVQLATDSLFTALIVNDSTVTGTSKIVTGLLNFTKYYWRVNAKNAGGTTAYSAIWNFTTIVSAPGVPVLLAPANNSLGIQLNPLLDWNAVATATSYRIQLGIDSIFGTTIIDTTITPDSLRIAMGKLALNIKYYWHVRASNVGGNSSYSATWNFRTMVTGIIANGEIPKEFKLYDNYPNPFNPSTKIMLDIPKAEYVQLKVYDILGRVVATILDENIQAGRYIIDFNAPELSSGVYFYTFKSKEYTSVKRMALIK